ncbi:MAG: fasciclin domain-containing protein [Pseudomonadota bacterium]
MRFLTKVAVMAVVPVALAACVSSQPEEPVVELDIVETAVTADDFNTLVAAVQSAGLVEVLQSDGPFTVFAPTDEAFAALPPGTVESLLLPENQETLVAILTYHVVPGEVFSSDIAGQVLSVETVQGSVLEVDATDGVVLNGNSTVVAADVDASNGVIHVIDAVLLPPN